MKLEKTFNKPYETLIKEYQNTQIKNIEVLQENSEFKKQNNQEKQKLKKTKKELQDIQKQIKKMLSTRAELNNVSLDKLSDLARFIPDFESLGYSPETIRLFAEIHDQLKKRGIDPNDFKYYQIDKIEMDKQIEFLNQTITTIQREVTTLENQKTILINQNPRLTTADQFTRTGIFTTECFNCDREFQMKTKSLLEYQLDHENVTTNPTMCPHCGFTNNYTAQDQMASIARIILP
jgi:hypothetical protein